MICYNLIKTKSSGNLDLSGSKMVRSLSSWTKTLSFPNRNSKENVNVHSISGVPKPTPARNKTNNLSPSPSPPSSPQNVHITEISQIVSGNNFK